MLKLPWEHELLLRLDFSGLRAHMHAEQVDTGFSTYQVLRFCLEISTLAVDTRDPVRHGRRMYVFLCACSKCGCVWVVAITQRRERNPPSVQKVVKSPAAPFFCLAKFLPTQRLWNSDLQNFMPGCLHFLKVFFFLEKLWQPSSSATSCTSHH